MAFFTLYFPILTVISGFQLISDPDVSLRYLLCNVERSSPRLK